MDFNLMIIDYLFLRLEYNKLVVLLLLDKKIFSKGLKYYLSCGSAH